MTSRFRLLRVLLPVGVVSQCVVASRPLTRKAKMDKNSSASAGAGQAESVGTRLAAQLEGGALAFLWQRACVHVVLAESGLLLFLVNAFGTAVACVCWASGVLAIKMVDNVFLYD